MSDRIEKMVRPLMERGGSGGIYPIQGL